MCRVPRIPVENPRRYTKAREKDILFRVSLWRFVDHTAYSTTHAMAATRAIMSTTLLTLAKVNDLSRAEFVAALGPLFEGSPWIADATWPARPFASIDQLHHALCATMYAAPIERQVALIQAHPDLAGKAA